MIQRDGRARRRVRRWIAWAALGGALSAPALAQAQSAVRVEPPFWWTGFRDGGLQLMLSGEGVGELTPKLRYPGVSVRRVRRADSPNYLFVYLDLAASTRPGRFDIALSGNGREFAVPYRLLEKSPSPSHAKGFSSADAIYLITPDRFANGDLDNDSRADLGDVLDRSQPGARHGGDLRGIARRLDYIADMGFTAIWLNPVLENRMPDHSYHGYATTDFYRVDPRYGSNEDFRELARAAKRRGIGVIMDVIVNHAGDRHPWLDDMPTTDWINFAGRYVQTNHEHITVQDPYAADSDRRGFADGWFVASMPDLNQRNPLLGDYLIQNALWWIEYLGLAGIRMDTYPYPDKNFMSRWNRRVFLEYPDFNVVGEEWSGNPAIVSYWQRGKKNRDGYVSGLPSLMDFPLHSALVSALRGEAPPDQDRWLPLYRGLANDFQYPDPSRLVVFADNHDMSRVFTQLNGDYALLKMALTYLATTRGTPQFYYGTEVLMGNPDSADHGVIRSDFPGGWRADVRNAFTGVGMPRQALRAQAFVRRLLRWRKKQPVIHRGQLTHYLPKKNVYVYFRYDDTDQVMVAMNRNARRVALGTRRFRERLGGYTHATDPFLAQRYALDQPLPMPPRSALVLQMRRAVPLGEPPARAQRLRDD